MSGRLGDLTAADIGSEVEFISGGATYRATLVTVQHEHGFRGDPRTMVGLKSGEWRHTKTYPAETPCSVTPTAPSPATGNETETTPAVTRRATEEGEQ